MTPELRAAHDRIQWLERDLAQAERVIAGVRSKTALDIVAEKMNAEDRAERAEAALQEMEHPFDASEYRLMHERTLAAEAALKTTREALRQIHDYNCGCARPGRLDMCVAQPVVLFAALEAGP